MFRLAKIGENKIVSLIFFSVSWISIFAFNLTNYLFDVNGITLWNPIFVYVHLKSPRIFSSCGNLFPESFF